MSYAALSGCCKLQLSAAVVFPTLQAHLIYKEGLDLEQRRCVCMCVGYILQPHVCVGTQQQIKYMTICCLTKKDTWSNILVEPEESPGYKS